MGQEFEWVDDDHAHLARGRGSQGSQRTAQTRRARLSGGADVAMGLAPGIPKRVGGPKGMFAHHFLQPHKWEGG